MIPHAEIRHCLPGRVRLAVSSMRGDENFFDGVRDALHGACNGSDVRVNPVTAGILIDGFDGTVENLQTIAHEHRLFELHLPDETPSAFSEMSSLLPDQRTMIVTALFSLAAVQAVRGEIMVPAVSLVLTAFGVLHWLEPQP